jgi:hypothetical protein
MKPSPPAADSLCADPQPLTDLSIRPTLCSKQHQLRAQHLTMRPRVARGAMHQLLALGFLEDDLLSAGTRHRPQIRRPRYDSFKPGRELRPTALSRSADLVAAAATREKRLVGGQPGHAVSALCRASRAPARSGGAMGKRGLVRRCRGRLTRRRCTGHGAFAGFALSASEECALSVWSASEGALGSRLDQTPTVRTVGRYQRDVQFGDRGIGYLM